MPLPIENLTGADAIAFREAIEPHVEAIFMPELEKHTGYTVTPEMFPGANDSAKIQAACDSGAAHVLLLARTYTMPAAVEVMTPGQQITGIAKCVSGGSFPCFRLKAAGALVAGPTFSGTGTVASTISDADGALVRMLAHDCTVRNCRFDGWKFGIEARGFNNPTITNNYFTNGLTTALDTNGTAGYAIDFRSDDSTHCYHGTIQSNFINGGAGVGIALFAEDSTSPSGGWNGNSNGGIHGVSILDNVVLDTFMYGIMLYRRGGSGTLNVDDCIISGNLVEGVKGSIANGGQLIYGTGIYVQGAERNLVEGNVVKNCAQFTGSTLLAPAGIGVVNVASVTIRNNAVVEIGVNGAPTAGGGGIWVKSSNVTPTAFAAGFGSDPEKGSVVIENNYVTRTRIEGIICTDVVRPIVRGNTLYQTGGGAADGIYVYRSGLTDWATDYAFLPSPVITQNVVRLAGQNGIRVNGTRDHQIDGNTVSANGADYDAISLANCGPGTVRGNTLIDAGGHAIFLPGTNDPAQLVTGNYISGGGSATRPAQISTSIQADIRDNMHVNLGAYPPVRHTSPAGADTEGWWRITAGDTAPAVNYCRKLRTVNTANTIISSFSNVMVEEFDLLVMDSFTRLNFAGALLSGNGETMYSVPAGSILRCVRRGTIVHVDVQPMPRVLTTRDAAYTLTMADAGGLLYHTRATPDTWTIPANSAVPFPVGTEIEFINENGASAVTLAITTDTLRWGANTGSRTLAANGYARAVKVAATVWRLTGEGIS